mgnify:FL=1
MPTPYQTRDLGAEYQSGITGLLGDVWDWYVKSGISPLSPYHPIHNQPEIRSKQDIVSLLEDPSYAESLPSLDPSGLGKGLIGVAGIFGGKLGRNAPHMKMRKFLELEKEGLSNEEAWKKTGVFRSPDGELRYEIDDSGSVIAPDFENLPKFGKLGPVRGDEYTGATYEKAPGRITHKELKKAYPEFEEIRFERKEGLRPKGDYKDADISLGYPGEMRIRGGLLDPKSTTLHELQHFVQGEEGFARGGTNTGMLWVNDELRPELIRETNRIIERMKIPMSIEDYAAQAWGSMKITPEIRADYKKYLKSKKDVGGPFTGKYSKFAQEQAAENVYLKLAGEAEARAVQKRRDLTLQERRQRFPLEDYDIPLEDLILRGVSPKTLPRRWHPRWSSSSDRRLPWEFVKKDADFYVQTKGSNAGKVMKESSANSIGVKVDRDHLLPDYAYYLFQYGDMSGGFKQRHKGTAQP